MRYIISPDRDGIQFGDYLAALREYSDQLPSDIAAFARDEERFTLNHPKSLHDAWLEQVSISESRCTDDVPSQVRISLELLGQTHDRKIAINYQNVTGYRLARVVDGGCSHATLHGDILTHEIRVSDNGLVVHEILFSSGDSFEVTCTNFTVEDKIITRGEQGIPPNDR